MKKIFATALAGFMALSLMAQSKPQTKPADTTKSSEASSSSTPKTKVHHKKHAQGSGQEKTPPPAQPVK